MSRRIFDHDYLLYGAVDERSSARAQSTTPAPPTNTNRLYLSQIPQSIDESALKKRFEVFGAVEEATLDKDTASGYVHFRHADDAMAAYQGTKTSTFDGHTIQGHFGLEVEQDTTAPSATSSAPPPPPPPLPQPAPASAMGEAPGARVFVCDYQDMEMAHVCGEQFTQNNSLKHHWWKHEWETRPLKCERDSTCVYTKKGFVTEGDRDRHYLRFHSPRDPRPFKCRKPSCIYHGKGFETANELKGHEYSHQLVYDEAHCDIEGCNFESTTEDEMNQHMLRMHGRSSNTNSKSSDRSTSQQPWRPDEKKNVRGSSRTTYPDEKQEYRRQTESSYGDEKSRARSANNNQQEEYVDYRPFKCQIKGCKFAKEGFESKQELDSHENGEHAEQLKELNIAEASQQDDGFGGTIRNVRSEKLATHQPAEASSSSVPTGAEFLRCNNVDCSQKFTSEQRWRDHSLGCRVLGRKQCSFTSCVADFPNAALLSAHEYNSHGIRICNSLSCNRAFHLEDNAVEHMRDMHSNLFKGGRRPKLAFISNVPPKSSETLEDGFPYDPYQCALLNLTTEEAQRQSRQQASNKGKAVAIDLNERSDRDVIALAPGNTRAGSSAAAVASSSMTASLPQTPVPAGDNFSEALPRYSMIMRSTSSPHFTVPTQSNEQDNRPEHASSSPSRSSSRRLGTSSLAAGKQRAPASGTRPAESSSTRQSSFINRDPRYRYNSDGSRYVNGAVILSPDRHKVLVLESKKETKKTVYELPRGYWEVNDQNGEAASLREAWQKAGVIGRIIKIIEPAPAELPDENGLADWHSYCEMEVESEKALWPQAQTWQRRWLSYREARVVLSGQPDLIRALERSIIFKRGSPPSPVYQNDEEASRQQGPVSVKRAPDYQSVRPKRKRTAIERRPPPPRKYTTISPSTDNVQAWRKEVLPWLRRNFSNVMGNNKNGAIELLRVRNRPTICITCSDPKGLQLDQLSGVVGDLFPMQVKVGLLARSGATESPKRKEEVESPEPELEEDQNSTVEDHSAEEEEDSGKPREFPLPPVYGKYHGRPTCGAPIGVANDENGGASAGTFGGVVVLTFPDGREAPYGLISHHVLEEKTEETELGVGVDDGWLVDAAGVRRFTIQQPSKMDMDEAMDSLNMQRYYCEREKRYCDVEDGKTVRAKLATNQSLDQHALDFGQVMYSSGYGLYRDRHQMDWALVGDIPPWRLEDNVITGADLFYDLHYDGRPKAPYPVEKTFFTFLSETFEGEGEQDMSELDPLRRVHGVGSYSGIMDGLVSSETSFFRLDGIDSEEWFFTPRYNGGLGVRGDSGTWVFDDFGKVVGQIIAYNYRTNVTYFSRMDYLFEHIKSRTKASEVYIPHVGYLAERKWKSDDTSRQEDRSVQSESIVSGSVDGSGTGTTSTSITVPSQSASDVEGFIKGDSGLGWTGLHS